MRASKPRVNVAVAVSVSLAPGRCPWLVDRQPGRLHEKKSKMDRGTRNPDVAHHYCSNSALFRIYRMVLVYDFRPPLAL